MYRTLPKKTIRLKLIPRFSEASLFSLSFPNWWIIEFAWRKAEIVSCPDIFWHFYCSRLRFELLNGRDSGRYSHSSLRIYAYRHAWNGQKLIFYVAAIVAVRRYVRVQNWLTLKHNSNDLPPLLIVGKHNFLLFTLHRREREVPNFIFRERHLKTFAPCYTQRREKTLCKCLSVIAGPLREGKGILYRLVSWRLNPSVQGDRWVLGVSNGFRLSLCTKDWPRT